MDLIFWRHAEADDWVEGCDDMQRSLTGRGEKQAKRMAAWLDRQLPEGTRIVCSPARRCEQTALAPSHHPGCSTPRCATHDP